MFLISQASEKIHTKSRNQILKKILNLLNYDVTKLKHLKTNMLVLVYFYKMCFIVNSEECIAV